MLRLGSQSRGLAELHFSTRGCKGESCVVGREALERLVGRELMTTFDETFEDGHHEMIDGVSVLRLGVPHQQERLLSIEVVLDRFSWRAVALAVLRATVAHCSPALQFGHPPLDELPDVPRFRIAKPVAKRDVVDMKLTVDHHSLEVHESQDGTHRFELRLVGADGSVCRVLHVETFGFAGFSAALCLDRLSTLVVRCQGDASPRRMRQERQEGLRMAAKLE